MKENSQIAFDFFTPPSKKPSSQVPVDSESVNKQEDSSEKTLSPEPVTELIPENTNEPIDLGYIGFTSPSTNPTPAKTRGRKSLKSYDSAASFTEVPSDDILFSKQYYPIGEVAQMFNVNASLLRYWESEFDILKPRKNKKGDRHFRPEDIRNLELIYDLLRRRKLTIDGARNFLKKNKSARERFEMIRSLQDMRSFLFELKASL